MCRSLCLIAFVINRYAPNGTKLLSKPWIELGLIGIALAVGLTSLFLAYFKHHRKIIPLLILLIGFMFILVGHLFENRIAEPAMVSAGGIFIVFAHYKNLNLTRRCTTNGTTHKLNNQSEE